ncbi:hypothetical protein [uncultured Fretibacterium sp.]|uniref:hypothetical protein n=1 Tax=uncultured Fretibacterium sp. TaxID=1678694 RepID=UPI002636FFA2|nr:hypothetical protein [uncultured Fretibacterium sp.]
MLRVDNGLSSLQSSPSSAGEAVSGGKGFANIEDALKQVEEAKTRTSEATFRAWDRHTDMVEKSQKLRRIRMRQEAIKRRNQEQRENSRELMAQAALQNANRTRMIEASAMKRKAQERTAGA